MLPLDLTQTKFNWPNARALAEASALAYATAAGPGGQWITDQRTNAECLLLDRGNCIVIAFRGSCKPLDFIQDAKFEFVDLITDGSITARVHKGFHEDFCAINESLVHTLNQLLIGRAAVPVFVTGHSLGGALAILCALELARREIKVAGVYTFGQPRVGNYGFRMIYKKTMVQISNPAPRGGFDWRLLDDITFHIVNENDIVPRVPPWINGYRHVGQNIFLPVLPSQAWIQNPSLWFILLSDALGLWGAFDEYEDVLIANHFLNAYEKRIQLLS